MKPRVCISLLPRTEKEVPKLIGRAERKNPDLIELRTDRLASPRVLRKARRATSNALIATDRSRREMGMDMIAWAAKEGFDYVDIDADKPDARALRKVIRETGAKTIVSTHHVRARPSQALLSRILEHQRLLAPDVAKIVTGARLVSDNLALLDFVWRQSKRIRLVAFATGHAGRFSRIYSPLFGAFFTFAALERGSETGQGQPTIDEIRQVWRLL